MKKVHVKKIYFDQLNLGCFNLDPNRVLDIILESFENSPTMFKTFIGLLKHYKAEDDTICQIVGFKFQALHQKQQQQASSKSDTKQEPDVENISIESLYKITSYLLKHNIIDLDSLTPHLYPNEQSITQSFKEEFESAKQYAKKLVTINLADANAASSITTLNNSSSSSNQMDTGSNQLINQQQQQQQQAEEKLNQLLQQTIKANKIDNQKIYLVKNLIEIGDYKTALRIIEKLPQWYIANYIDVTIAICRSIDANLVDPIYKKYNLLSKYLREKYLNKSIPNSKQAFSLNKSSSLIDEEAFIDEKSKNDSEDMLVTFVDVILPLLSALGPGVSYDTILFTKLIRICVSFLEIKNFTTTCSLTASLNGYSEQHNIKESTPPIVSMHTNGSIVQQEGNVLTPNQILANLSKSELSFYNQIYSILNEILLPSLSMISMNPCLAIELWNLLKTFPYEMR